jgi:hypothetical protein
MRRLHNPKQANKKQKSATHTAAVYICSWAWTGARHKLETGKTSTNAVERDWFLALLAEDFTLFFLYPYASSTMALRSTRFSLCYVSHGLKALQRYEGSADVSKNNAFRGKRVNQRVAFPLYEGQNFLREK